MLKAKPNRNGNNVADFREAYSAMNEANAAMIKALKLVQLNVVHGRNYQSGQTEADRKTDLDLLDRAEKARKQIEVFESLLMHRVINEMNEAG